MNTDALAGRRSTRLAVTIGAATLAATALTVTSGAAAWAQEPVVLSSGHVDALDVHYDAGELQLKIKDDSAPPPVVRDPAETSLHVLPEAAIAVPDDARYGFLGTAGDTVWVLPQVQDPELLWPGWSTERLSTGTFVGNQVTLTLVDVDGPGEVSVFTVNAFGDPQLRWRFAGGTIDPAALTVPINTHAHANWAFSAEGSYTLSFQVDASLASGGTVSSGAVDYTFVVGDLDGDPGDPPPPQTTLTVTGLQASYQPGDPVSLTAVQDPATELDHYHWFSRCPGENDWAVVPGEGTESYTFTATAALDGCEYHARLYDDDHAVTAKSPPVTLHVADPGTPDLSQTIVATIDESQGALVVSVDPSDRTVVLPAAELAPAGDRLFAEGDLRPVTVTDTRSAAPGWNVSGQSSAFTGTTGGFGSDLLGWTPAVLEQAHGQGVKAGTAIGSGFGGGDGLGVSRVLGSAPSGKGLGTSRLGAGLELHLPTQTPAGEYTSTLTLTAI